MDPLLQLIEDASEEEEHRRRRRKWLLLFIFVLLEEERVNNGRTTTQYRDFLSLVGTWRRDRRIPRCALVDPSASPWEKLYSSGSDQALITVTGFDHAAFGTLLSLFERPFYAHTPWTGKSDGSTMKRLNTQRLDGKTGRPLTPHGSKVGIS